MEQQFTGLGLRFRYPDGWELSEDMSESEASLTVSSPQTAFWSVTILRHRPEPKSVLRTVVEAYTEEYDELDIVESEVELAIRRVPAVEISFVCLELTNTACLRAFQTDRCTILMLYQLNDSELDAHESVLHEICQSLVCESDLEPL